jgi:DNA-binding response OmpR family regulator
MKILVVEDEHKIANSIKKGLELEKYVVDVSYDGEDGYDLASSQKYDVIVLDLMLPKKDGNSIVKDLRKGQNHTPILILTAKGELADKKIGFDNGADDYLVKPFAFEELLMRIKALARRPEKINNSLLKSGDLEINTESFEVKKNGKMIVLSRKEFSILEFLMKNKGKIVSKDSIISYVWDYDSDVLPNTVEVFIGYLREKIGKETIKTVRGDGAMYKPSDRLRQAAFSASEALNGLLVLGLLALAVLATV